MSYSNGKISVPISIADVKSVLGSSSNDLGSLCKSALVNKWAKYKPVIVSQLLTTKDNWFKADTLDYGITIPKFSSPTSVLQAYENNTYHWTYQQPTGGTSSPYRLTDFNGYNHNSLAQIRSQSTAVKTTFVDTDELGISFISTKSVDSDTVGLGDLGLDGYYMSAALFKEDGTFLWIGSGSLISNDGGASVILNPKNKTVGTTWAVGKYKLVPMLSSYNYTSVTNTLYSATYIPLDVGKVVDIEIIASTGQVAAKFKSITGTKALSSYTVKMIMKDGIEAVKSVTVYFCHTTNPTVGSPSLVDGETYKTLSDLQAGKTYSSFYSGNSSYSSYKAYVYADGEWVAKGLAFIQTADPTISSDEESSDEATTTSETTESQSETT